MHILYKLATRSRTTAAIQTVTTIVDEHSGSNNYEILVSLDHDDSCSKETEAKLKNFPNVTCVFGTSKNKIDAINRDIEKAKPWHILVNVSDDQRFIKNCFDLTIVQAFQMKDDRFSMDESGWGGNVIIEKGIKYDLDQFLHLPDGTPAAATLPSMSIMGRDWYDRFGYIYHKDYISLWSDNESMEVAQILGKYKYVDLVIYNHLHPWWVPGLPVDDQLKHTQTFYDQDQKTFNRRKRHGFPLHSVYS